jgi:hypothetical protein
MSSTTGADSRPEGRRPVLAPTLALGLVLVAFVFALGLVVRGAPLPLDTAVADFLAASFPRPPTDLFNTLGELPVFGAGCLCVEGWLRRRFLRPV